MSRSCKLIVIVALASIGCSGEDSSTQTISTAKPETAPANQGPPESVYQLERRTEVRIEIAEEDWDALRYEGRSLTNLEQSYEYTEYYGTVTVDGVVYEGVEIKKKGFIGSLSAIRPSMRLDFQRGGVALDTGLRRLTLNGDVQDRSHVRQCMAFELFARAGVPAPRCSLANVFVNGKDLGTYTNVEPIRKPMLRRHFADADGNLYEGTLADFDDATWEKIEVKNNESTNDRSDLRRLVAALNESDETLVAALEEVIDLEAFRTFWAVETLIGHWDGYAETANNYYLYADPGRERFVFLPWGVDQAFMGSRPFTTRPYDPTVYAGAKLTRRLYTLPEQRDLFRERLRELSDALWDVPDLLEQASALAALAPDLDEAALAAHEEFLRTHGDSVREALAQPPAPLDALDGPPAPPPTCVASRPLAASFDSQWNTEEGSLSAALELDGKPMSLTFAASVEKSDETPYQASITGFAPLDASSGLVLTVLMPTEQVARGKYRFHATETFGVVGRVGFDGTFILLGFVGDGYVEFDRASKVDGATVSGRIEALFHQSACLDPSLATEE